MENQIHLDTFFSKIYEAVTNLISKVSGIYRLFLKYWYVTLLVVTTSVILGLYLDSNKDQEKEMTILVHQNLNAANYLYEAIDKLNLHIVNKDSVFLKKHAFLELNEISIEPIIDLETVLRSTDVNTRNLEAVFNEVPVSSENKNQSILNDEAFVSNYLRHRIVLKAKDDVADDIDKILLHYLNSNNYFEELRLKSIEGIKMGIKYDYEIISQIDSILLKEKTLSTNNSSNFILPKSDTDINNLFITKKTLVNDIKNEEIRLLRLESVVTLLNNPSLSSLKSKLSSRSVFIIPLFSIICLALFFLLIMNYKSY